MERTFVILKPDAVQRGLVGEIIARFERRGLKLVAMKFMQVSDELARKHYAVHAERPFFFRADPIHCQRAGGGAGARGNQRDCCGAQHGGGHQTGRGRAGHHPR